MGRRENIEARENILRTSHQLIWERGYKGVSMADLAVAAGVKKANLFHYYPTKEALGLAVFDRAAAEYRHWIAAELDREGDPVANVCGLFDAIAGLMRGKHCSGGCFVGNVAQELSDENEAIRLRVEEVFAFWIGKLRALFERGRQSGYFRMDLDPDVAADAILAMLQGGILVAKARKDTTPLDHARQAAASYLAGFRT